MPSSLFRRLRDSLDRRRTAETSIRPRIYFGADGFKRHLVRSTPGGPLISVAGPMQTYRPGALVQTGSHSNIDPAETILSEPPHAGASENPPIVQRRLAPGAPPLITALDPSSQGVGPSSSPIAAIDATGQSLRGGQTIVSYVSVDSAPEVAVEYPTTAPASLEVISVDFEGNMVVDLHHSGHTGGETIEIRAAIKNELGFEFPASPGVLFTLSILGL